MSEFVIWQKISGMFKKIIVSDSRVGEGLVTFRSVSLFRKIIFKSIKALRNLLFLIPFLVIYIKENGKLLYFQATSMIKNEK